PGFLGPGPHYGSSADAVLRCKVDNLPWRHIPMMANATAIPLAENLPPGLHKVTVEWFQGSQAPIDKFLFALKPLAGVKGFITSPQYSELMTDARADIYRGSRLIRSEYIRNPLNGRFVLLGLEPGTYRIRFSASGWQAQEVKDIVIRGDGKRVDLGVVSLPFDQDLIAYYGFNHRNGKSLNVQPGGTFAVTPFPGSSLKRAELVSRYKTIPLKVGGPVTITGSGMGTNNGVSLTLPDSVPHDMYALRFTRESSRGEWTQTAPQVVCVRDPLPDSFALAAMGHMNTWGQQTSEYLAKVTQMAQLAGARAVLISNEVNAAYIAGALKELSIPYLITSGNHTMGRWDDFFGPHSYAYDDGPLRVVTFSSDPTNLWHDPAHWLAERPDATNRVLLSYESFAPLDLIRDKKVNLLFDAHSLGDHPDRAKFPTGTLHIAATDFQTMRWIPMTHSGLDRAIQKPDDAPALIVPRSGPAPLRVEHENGNAGLTNGETARIINRYAQRFPHARVRLVLKAGEYSVRGGKLLQSFVSDDGKLRIFDVEADVAPNSETMVRVESLTK
ncbi:MAG TPA: carboxypeptidase-like regulatory domain-containing protein, partial [Abditibacteriaceae bacterium]|nr:carboxypeptidase-like regulatory domain-containing protein [Abditibacteriaceae bacterium]